MSKNLKINEDGTILIKNVRLSYPHLFEKFVMEGDDEAKGRYSGKFMLDSETHAEEIRELRLHLVELQKEFFKGKIGGDKLFLRNGDDLGKEDYEGQWVVSASDSKRRPQVLNKDKSVITEEDDIVYAGCYVHVVIRPWKQEHPKYGKRINANLCGVQFHKDGERFGEAPTDASEHFDDEDDDRSSKSKSKSGSKSGSKTASKTSSKSRKDADDDFEDDDLDD